MVHYVVLTTGSCGNCYIFYDEETSIVIDCGVTYKKLSEEMSFHSIPSSSLSGMFLTHLHPDHAKGVGVFQRKTGLPVYVSKTCFFSGKTEMEKLKMEKDKTHYFEWNKEVKVGSFTVIPFETFHDSPGSSGYYIKTKDGDFFLLTDTGEVPSSAFDYAYSSRVKFIEANYDENMLECGIYPKWLKDRVKGKYGHLSNTSAIELAKNCSNFGDQVYFIHVSENNNETSIINSLIKKRIPSGIFCKACERGEMFEGFLYSE